MKHHPYINALKPYIGKDVIAIDYEEVITDQLFISNDQSYGIGNPMRPDWIFSPYEIKAVTPIPAFETAVIRVRDEG